MATPALAPASLDTAQLSRRLGELAGHERQLQVEFLLHLEEFDQRRGWAEAGYPSLWEWCLRVLHLREGAAARRLAAMRVLRRFPSLAEALRDGRLCLSTLAALGPVLTAGNCDEVAARAAFLTKAEVEHLVVSLQPRQAPREGLRLIPSSAAPRRETPPPQQEPAELTTPPGLRSPARPCAPPLPDPRPASQGERDGASFNLHDGAGTRSTLEPISSNTYSLRATVDADFKRDLEQLKGLLAHKFPDGNLGSVLGEAVKCALAIHGKRKGAVEPTRKRSDPVKPSAPAAHGAPSKRPPIPAAVRREVWKRDGGACAWRSPDGHRCGSSWMLELDHVVPVARGGASTIENLRVCCRSHNALHADHVFGREHMQLFRRDASRPGEATSPSGSGNGIPAPGRSGLERSPGRAPGGR